MERKGSPHGDIELVQFYFGVYGSMGGRCFFKGEDNRFVKIQLEVIAFRSWNSKASAYLIEEFLIFIHFPAASSFQGTLKKTKGHSIMEESPVRAKVRQKTQKMDRDSFLHWNQGTT